VAAPPPAAKVAAPPTPKAAAPAPKVDVASAQVSAA